MTGLEAEALQQWCENLACFDDGLTDESMYPPSSNIGWNSCLATVAVVMANAHGCAQLCYLTYYIHRVGLHVVTTNKQTLVVTSQDLSEQLQR